MKFEIKHRDSGAVLFSGGADSLRLCVEAAVKSGADLSCADLSCADLRGADLRGADLRGANLYGANLYGANLSDADLRGANLRGADLRGADLYGANLSDADLYGAHLSRADLRGADLRGADLRGANLYGANLSDADLRGANLRGADLRGANLSCANLYGATGYNPHRIDPLLLLKDQVGKIRAYKLVKADGLAPFNGGITYEKGKSYEVKDASTNENEQCAAGINLATLPWCMKEWQKGYRILIAEFTAKDIACIPLGNDGKFRVFRCRIVGEKDLKEIGLVEQEKQP